MPQGAKEAKIASADEIDATSWLHLRCSNGGSDNPPGELDVELSKATGTFPEFGVAVRAVIIFANIRNPLLLIRP
jgi:hypothetical protein